MLVPLCICNLDETWSECVWSQGETEKQHKLIFYPTPRQVESTSPRKKCANTKFFSGLYFPVFGLNTEI